MASLDRDSGREDGQEGGRLERNEVGMDRSRGGKTSKVEATAGKGILLRYQSPRGQLLPSSRGR